MSKKSNVVSGGILPLSVKEVSLIYGGYEEHVHFCEVYYSIEEKYIVVSNLHKAIGKKPGFIKKAKSKAINVFSNPVVAAAGVGFAGTMLLAGATVTAPVVGVVAAYAVPVSLTVL